MWISAVKYSAWYTANTGTVGRVVVQVSNGSKLVPLFPVLARCHFQRSLDCGMGPLLDPNSLCMLCCGLLQIDA